MTSVFVAGSRKLGQLNEEIRERLNNLINQEYKILVGDANGADKAVQTYLHNHTYKNVTVYCSGNYCRNNIGNWKSSSIAVDKSLKGRDFYTVKDKKMAEDADYGLMIWDGKSPGTLNNVLELLTRNKKTLLYFFPTKEFISITNHQQVEELLNRCSPDAVQSIKKKVNIKSDLHTSTQGTLNF